MTKKKHIRIVFIILIFIVVLGLIVDINTGYAPLKISDFINIVKGTAPKSLSFTLIELRMPRIIMVIFVGLGLSVAGCVLQGVSKNELADSGILGINSGAGLGVALYILLFSKSLENPTVFMPIIAFIFGLLTAAAVYLLAYVKNQGISVSRLLLTGIATSSAITSITIILLLKMRQEEYGFMEGWLSGNIWGASWGNIKIMVPWIFILLIFVIYKSRTLNVLNLGTQTAIGLGVSMRRQSLTLLIAAVGLSSMCVAVGGGIVFVGLICPHIARKLVGPKHQLLLLATALCGVGLLVISDVISRTILSPNEVSIGIVVAIIGSPYFLYLLAKSK